MNWEHQALRLPCKQFTWLLTNILYLILYFSKFSLTFLLYMYVCIWKSEDNLCWCSFRKLLWLSLDGPMGIEGVSCWPEILLPYLLSTRVTNISHMLSFLGVFWDQTGILMLACQYVTSLAISSTLLIFFIIQYRSQAWALSIRMESPWGHGESHACGHQGRSVGDLGILDTCGWHLKWVSPVNDSLFIGSVRAD